MTVSKEALSAWQNLALAYVNPCFRAPFELLLNLDNRLFSVATRGKEPLLAQMRIAWWREQIAKPTLARARGEQLLAALSELESKQTSLNLGDLAMWIVDAWEIVATSDAASSSITETEFADLRSKAIFESYANWMKAMDSERAAALSAGQRWAHLSIGIDAGNIQASIGRLRPLSILLKATELDLVQSPIKRRIGALRLGIHALTGL